MATLKQLALMLASLVVTGCAAPSEPAVPAALVITTQPGDMTAGSNFLIVVRVVDQSGNLVKQANNVVTLTLDPNPNNAYLSGTQIVNAVAGQAAFRNLQVQRMGNGYTVTAKSNGLRSATSVAFKVAAGPAAALRFVNQPGLTTAGVAISPALSVELLDAYGNKVTGPALQITLFLAANPGGATLSGTVTVPALNGVAEFPDVRMDKAGQGYKIGAHSGDLLQAASAPFTVIGGPPVQLGFSVQPPALTATDGWLAPAVRVTLRDQYGNATTASSSVTLALGDNPGGAILSGTTTRETFDGEPEVVFPDLSLNLPGTGYTLVATAPGLSSAKSDRFSIRESLHFTAVSAGYFHTCGLALGGQAYCWGEGLLGDGPVAVAGGISFVSISSGRDHRCGLTAAGEAYCWGYNNTGALGDGSQESRSVPTRVAGGLVFASVLAGYQHSCGLTLAGAAYCWGSNFYGEVGDGGSNTNRLTPTPVSGSMTFLSVSPGRNFSCGVTVSHAAYCWGDNSDGELGNGTNTNAATPIAVAGGLTFNSVGAGGFHACGLTPGGQVYCWGRNQLGTLGTGTTVSSNVPMPVSTVASFVSLSVGNRHSCGITSTGALYCWGDNSDANLGDGTTITRMIPTSIGAGLVFAQISAGRFHSCGVTTDQSVYCWGNNFDGKVGAGPRALILAPIRVR